MMKRGRGYWIAKIIWHVDMVLCAFSAGCFLMTGPKQDTAVGIYIGVVTVLLVALYLYSEWRYT